MRRWLLILLLAIPLIHAGLLRSPEPVDASGDVVLATGTVTLANTKLSLADSYAFFDFATDMTPWIGETIEICPATTASKHYCIRGLVSTVGTGETLGAEKSTGTLTIGLLYVITATESNHFGTGYVIGRYFTASAATTCDANNKVQQATSPSTTGHWIKKSAASTTDGDGWSQKSASFLANDSAGYYWRIIKSRPVGTYTDGNSSVTSANVRLATVDGGAMVEIVGKDLSAYSGVDAYTPPRTNLQLHLKADAGCYTDAGKTTACTNDGDKAYTWADQSGNGNDAVQATEGYRPLYKTSIVGSLPAIRFNGSISRLEITSLTDTANNAVYIVAKNTTQTSGGSIHRPLLTGGGASDCYTVSGTNYCYGYARSGNDSVIMELPDGTTEGQILALNPITNSAQLLTFTNTSTIPGIYRNGAKFYNGAVLSRTSGFSASGHHIGSDGTYTSSRFYLGDIYEILVYNTAHDDATRTRIERYLAGKWGITSYQPTYAATSPARYMLALYDSAGKMATGYIGGPGAGETLSGVELLTGWTNRSGAGGYDTFTTSGANITSAIDGDTGNVGMAYSNQLTASGLSKLYKFSFTETLNSGTAPSLRVGSAADDEANYLTLSTANGANSLYFNSTNASLYVGLLIGTAPVTNFSTASSTIRQVTDIGIAGVHLHSTPNAYDRKMARVDSGFNPNAVTSYKIYQVAPAGYELDSILQEDGSAIWGNEGINIYLQQEG